MGAMLEFHNFSIHGDDRWYRASHVTRWAPMVVIWILVLSILEITMGGIWLAQIGSDMEIAKIFHTLIIPGLSFFNAVPSLHLHMLLRRNSPVLCMWFSFTLALTFFVISVLLLGSCSSNSAPVDLRNNLCQAGRVAAGVKGPNPTLWAVMVGCLLITFILYALHGGMAVYVNRFIKREEAEKLATGQNTELSTFNEADMQRARELWRQQGRYNF